MPLTCCNEPRPIHDQPDPDDAEEKVGVNCGHCGHDYGTMPLAEAAALLKEGADSVRAGD